MKRRDFIRNMGFATAGLALSPSGLLAETYAGKTNLLIMHTNDMHSHIEPFADNDPKYPGQGGMAKRAGLIASLREENDSNLLFDCGDIFQGTPYFNYFLGELEIKLMNEMGYDAATLGNHDFDGGLDNLADKIDMAKFPFINSNYDCTGTILENRIKPYHIFHRNGWKVGVTGVGINPEGLIDKRLYGEIKYLDPVERTAYYADILKNKKKCDIVVCLSHLGYSYETDKVSDKVLASSSKDINIILGGHTHTFMKEPSFFTNKSGEKVLVSQAGWAGLMLGMVRVSGDIAQGEVNVNSSLKEIF